ncbi:MAG TPA: aldehyde dehydrogenase family protein [Myxococcota bacterium]|nr:aldehyde dehydrogenase family protein [Myxococcota bacterium]
MTSPHTLTIDGKAVRTDATFPVIDPAAGTPFAEAPDATREQLDQAMAAAESAFRSWRRDEAKRRQVLLACADAIQANVAPLARTLTQEQGKPLARATEEIFGCAVWFRYTAGLEIPVEVVRDDPQGRVEIRRRPLGVVGAITPWNFPVLLAVWKIAPALLAGNTVVLKPSPFTPLATLQLGEVLRDVVPAGVVNVISGGDQLGSWITSHPAVRKVSFTGSVATGKKVAAAAAPDLKRVTLELGGNDAAIVLDDVDPKAVAPKLFWGAFANSGQVCSAIKRVYVPEALYEPLAAELATLARGVKVGRGLDEGTELGPVNNKPQFERVRELVDDAKAKGGRILAGGAPVEGTKGYFYQPTIVADLEDGTRLVDEEQFGPALPILRYRDVEDAVQRANATHFGLSGSIWSARPERASELAADMECGTVWINQHMAIMPNTPFGGAKWSGIGVENGPWGLLGFTELQVVNVAR